MDSSGDICGTHDDACSHCCCHGFVQSDRIYDDRLQSYNSWFTSIYCGSQYLYDHHTRVYSVSYTHLDVYKRQALNIQAKHPEWNMVPEIMIPLVGEVKELAYVKKVVTETADAIIASVKSDMKYKVGTMIEIPRAAITADEIAKQADFFSFGTNDLTQMTFGFSRDDAGKFLDAYYDRKIYENDPFAKLDQKGVGRLIEMAAKLGRTANPDLHLGICGEHGGDPSSVEFCHRVGLDLSLILISAGLCPFRRPG